MPGLIQQMGERKHVLATLHVVASMGSKLREHREAVPWQPNLSCNSNTIRGVRSAHPMIGAEQFDFPALDIKFNMKGIPSGTASGWPVMGAAELPFRARQPRRGRHNFACVQARIGS